MSRRNPGEGSIYQRSDGRWTGSIQVNGKRSYVYGKTERDVRRKLLALQKRINVDGTLPTPGNKNLNDLLDTWLQNVRHTLKPRTIADYESHCDRYIRPVLGSVKLSRLTPVHLQNLYSDMQGRGIGRTTLYVHAILHRALHLAVLWNWLAQNPADRIIKPRHRAERKELWTPDELARFLESSKDDWLSPVWIVAIATGCRLGELVGLKWEDVDLTTGILAVRRNLQPINGQWVESTPKTRAGERAISLPREAVSALRRQKAQQAEWRLQASESWRNRELVFTMRNGDPLSRSTIEHALTRQMPEDGNTRGDTPRLETPSRLAVAGQWPAAHHRLTATWARSHRHYCERLRTRNEATRRGSGQSDRRSVESSIMSTGSRVAWPSPQV